MRNLLTVIFIFLAILSVACYKTASNNENPVVIVTPTPPMNATPEQVALALFEAARYTNWSRLPTLCMPDGSSERSAKEICDVGKSADDKRTAFREDFKQGGTDGIAAIDGDSAKINIKYAKKLAKTAELTLKRVDGKWYLVSFGPK
ncbi:MAG: hypothetical protein JNL64_15300 [Blastocatellia bacterium]|nr:hypothetical protein [Blastocatellia bacterium]